MDISTTVSTTLRQHPLTRPAFVNNGSFYNNTDIRNMMWSHVSGFAKIDTVSLQSRKQYNLVKPLQVKREDSEGALSWESVIVDEQTLNQELQIAIQNEDYAQAAKIRDDIKHLHEDSKAAVLTANSRFYNSFRKGDLAAMQALWSKSENVCVVHPGVNGISGYELVMGSWEFVWADYEFPLSIDVKDVQVQVRGDVGYVTCVETVRTTGKSWGSQFATNVFEKIDGQWFICIHHASHVDL